MTDLDLKPCPFCDGEAELDTLQGFRPFDGGPIEDRVVVYCLSCSADMGECYSDHGELSTSQLKEIVVNMWNRRGQENG